MRSLTFDLGLRLYGENLAPAFLGEPTFHTFPYKRGEPLT